MTEVTLLLTCHYCGIFLNVYLHLHSFLLQSSSICLKIEMQDKMRIIFMQTMFLTDCISYSFKKACHDKFQFPVETLLPENHYID